MAAEPLLSVEKVSVEFATSTGALKVVEDVSFTLSEGEVLGLVGESGSGKSMTALAILGLLPMPLGRVSSGTVKFQGRDLLKMKPRELRKIRGGQISMVFQEPMAALNPIQTIGRQIIEMLRLHEGVSKSRARARALEMLDLVRIPAAGQRIDSYPHQLSGGMRQRAMLALALICRPKLLIADEPTTALDVTTQAQILDLLQELQSELGMAVILISHDLGVVAQFTNRLVVMYAGRVAEIGPVESVFVRPSHPYTRALLKSIPRADIDVPRLEAIAGVVPNPHAMPHGCRFAPRCDLAVSECRSGLPALRRVGLGHEAACIRADDMALQQ